MRFLFAFLFCLTNLFGFGQNIPLSDFTETNLLESAKDNYYGLNSAKGFCVNNKDGKLTITKATRSSHSELLLPSGKLMGYNGGEWGGHLIFKSFDTTKKEIEIEQLNVKFIFSFENKIFVISGLAHMRRSYGTLYQLDTLNDSFKIIHLISFEDSPEAYSLYKDTLLIASHKNFYIVHDFKKQIIIEGAMWDNLYPNSVAAFDDKHIYIGIRGGYVKLDLTTRKLTFYKYKDY